MSSTDLAAPSRRLLLTAILIVVGLHVLTVVALAAIKTPELKIDKKETPPIEIELVTPPPPPPVEIEEIKIEEKPEPVREVKPKPKPKAQPVAAPKPKPAPKPEPIVKEKTVTPKTKPVAPVKKQEIEKPPEEPLVDPKIAQAAADEQRRIIAAQAEKAAQQAQAQKAREAQAIRDAQEQAARDAAAEKAAAEAKAAREATARAQAEAAAEKAAAAASNTPQNFTATNANWASAPRFSFPSRAARSVRSGEPLTVVLRLRVNKQGGIDSVSVAKSSGNKAVDIAAESQVRSGKFKPFTKNGVPVVGNVTLPVSYQAP